MKKISILLVISLRLFIIAKSQNEVFDYNPKLNFSVGKGIEILSFSSKLFSPFKDIFLTFEKPNGSQSTSTSSSIITSERQFNESLSISAKVKCRYIGASLSGEYKIDKESILNENSLTICFAGETNFGKQLLTTGPLTKEALDLLKRKQFEEFVRIYGDYFCNAVERGSRVNIYLTIQNISQSLKQSLQKSVSGGGSLGKFSASAEASLNQIVSSSQSNNSVKISISSNGDSTGFSQLTDLLKAGLKGVNPTQNTIMILESYLKTFNRENSAITKYYFVPSTAFGIPKQFIKWSPTISRAFEQVDSKLDSLKLLLEEVRNLSNSSIFIHLATLGEKKRLEEYKITLFSESSQTKLMGEKLTNLESLNSLNIDSLIALTEIFPENETRSIDSLSKYVVAISKLNDIQNNYLDLFSNAPPRDFVSLNIPNLNSKTIRLKLICMNEVGVLHKFEFSNCQGYPLDISISTAPQYQDPNFVYYNVPQNSTVGFSPVKPRRLLENSSPLPFPISIDNTGIVFFSDYYIYETPSFKAAGDILTIYLSFDSRNDFRPFCKDINSPPGPFPLKIFPNASLEILFE